MVEDTMFSGESKNIEYKVSLPDKSEKYMKTIVAFANAVSDSCVPQIIPDIEPQTVNGKTVIVVSVEASLPDWETLLSFCCPVWSSEMSG